jgi:FkbM family methyltransferase
MCYFALEGFRVNAGDVVVDLGANCGLFSVLAAKMGARVLAVEAQSGFVKELQEIARLNDVVDRIAIEWALIGARAGDLSKAENLAKASHWEGNTPPQVSLESLLEKHRLSHVSFLKVDIEGSEFDLFGGEENALARIHRIAMEIHLDHGQADDVLEPLQRSGFKTALLSPELRLASQLSTPLGYVFAWRS